MAKIATKTTGADSVTFEFTNGTNLTFELSNLPAHIVERLAVHGLSQKLGDTYASLNSVDEAIAAVEATFAMMREGDWTRGRESTGGILAEALSRVTGQSVEDCRNVIKGLDDKAKRKLTKDPRIERAVAEIKIERLGDVDEDAPLPI